jgi:hypothetical protein
VTPPFQPLGFSSPICTLLASGALRARHYKNGLCASCDVMSADSKGLLSTTMGLPNPLNMDAPLYVTLPVLGAVAVRVDSRFP